MAQPILLKGCREHNLKNITVSLPRNRLIVITGLSGSGKSSLAFDTLYAEGQRRYVESLSTYARQFLGLMEKPDVDAIEGLSPTISIEQKTAGHNPRSTVGTATEIHDHLRLLFARVGTPTCPQCGKPIRRQTVQEITDSIMELAEGTRFHILSPVVTGRKGEYRDLFQKLLQDGFARVRVDDQIFLLKEEIPLDRNKKHTIEVVIDRLIAGRGIRERLTDSLETALKLSENGSILLSPLQGEPIRYSERFTCAECGIGYEELTPRMFSFNNPFGACPRCKGLGYLMELDTERMIPDPSLSLQEGAIVPWNASATLGSWNRQIMLSVCRHFSIPVDRPFSTLQEKQIQILLHGSGEEKIRMEWEARSREGRGHFLRPFEGVIPNLLRRYRESASEEIRRWIEQFMTQQTCPDCNGKRLRRESLAVLLDRKNIADVSSLAIDEASAFFERLTLSGRKAQIARPILSEIRQRLEFLRHVGLSYLSLDRGSSTLSGGESQRIRLATQIGSGLTGVIYILDEPSIGLHPRDNGRLLDTLRQLRDQENTVIVVEHDRETMLAANHLIDMGPGAGIHGGKLVACGPPDKVAKHRTSLTGRYLSGRKNIPIPPSRRSGQGPFLTLCGAGGHNLRNIDVSLPLGCLVCITGVSGSGKSSLINETLYPALSLRLHRAKSPCLPFRSIEGLANIDKVINIDQSPIGRTPRSNPATYSKTFEGIRDLYAALPESKLRGYQAGRFSFNVKGGRCESCQGDGVTCIEMHFLPDIYVTCEACKGKRYNRETLEVTFKGKNIADVLGLTVEEAAAFFRNIPQIRSRLDVLARVGLGYLPLGQPATALSGGEAQRIKLATELARRSTGKTLYLLDEPTTGLHFEDILFLMAVLQELVDRGNTVVIIEHNLDVIQCADHIIDLGPEGGDKGGMVVATGTPEEISAHPDSITGRYLKPYLNP